MYIGSNLLATAGAAINLVDNADSMDRVGHGSASAVIAQASRRDTKHAAINQAGAARPLPRVPDAPERVPLSSGPAQTGL
jgi:hypothetical protein